MANKALGLLRLVFKYVTRSVFDKVYKMYVRPDLDRAFPEKHRAGGEDDNVPTP